MEDYERMIADLPEATIPVVRTEAPNAPIPLYDGPLTFSGYGVKDSVTTGSLVFSWMPDPCVRISVPRAGSGMLNLEHTAVSFPGITTPTPANLTSGTISLHGERSVAGSLSAITTVGTEQSCDHVIAHIPNLRSYFGGLIRDRDRRASWRGRLDLSTGEWEVYLDEVPDEKKLRKALREQGGYALTHVASVRRVDGQPFSRETADVMLERLGYFLAFVRGAWCRAVLPTGFLDDVQSWQIWSSPHLTPWSPGTNWFVSDGDSGEIRRLFTTFLDQMGDPDWNYVLTTAIHWYVEANLATAGVEAATIMTQSALELLAWHYLVGVKKTHTPADFEGSFANNLKQLLHELQIKIRVPKTKQIPRDTKSTDFPTAFVAV